MISDFTDPVPKESLTRPRLWDRVFSIAIVCQCPSLVPPENTGIKYIPFGLPVYLQQSIGDLSLS